MRVPKRLMSCAAVLWAMALPAVGQSVTAPGEDVSQPATAQVPVAAQSDSASVPETRTVQQLLDSADAETKFDLRDLMEVLSDRRHEGWVLAAYPDPKTGHPLIGAGFSLDLPAREHPQSDELNPHPFLEPSSAEIWQAAGLDPDRLKAILNQFDGRMAAWTKKGFRRKIATLDAQVTDEEAAHLFRVFALQAVYNAKAYCRYFDRLTGAQQMAMSQLVYQMGFNLQEFSEFLARINTDYSESDGSAPAVSESAIAMDGAYWKSVQQTLIQSQWARLYRTRAVAVIAMLDPRYDVSPASAERRVGAMLRPAVLHRRSGRSAATLERTASHRGRSSEARAGNGRRRARVRQEKKRG